MQSKKEKVLKRGSYKKREGENRRRRKKDDIKSQKPGRQQSMYKKYNT